MAQTPINLNECWVPDLPDNEPPWTAEEIRMSTPYSDVRTWRRILICQLRWGESCFQGPPGLLTKLAGRVSSSKTLQGTSQTSIQEKSVEP